MYIELAVHPHAYGARLQMNRKLYVPCNFNSIFVSEKFLKVTGGHVHCTCGGISETLQERLVATNRPLVKYDIAY